MGFLSRILVPKEKELLIRRLLQHRPQHSESRDATSSDRATNDISTFILMGLPEATIVTCVESWAELRRQGVPEKGIVDRLAALRKAPSLPYPIDHWIKKLVLAEHGLELFVLNTHFDWCIQEAKKFYGLSA